MEEFLPLLILCKKVKKRLDLRVRVVELKLGLRIILLADFRRQTGIVSALSNNLRDVYLDEAVADPRSSGNRYRYSLAHEVGHIFLHGDLFKDFPCKSAYDWKRFMCEVDTYEYGWLETHAYQFAGLVLVPPEILRAEVTRVRAAFEKNGLKPQQDNVIFEEYAVDRLKGRFQVSGEVIEKRLRKDGLSIF